MKRKYLVAVERANKSMDILYVLFSRKKAFQVCEQLRGQVHYEKTSVFVEVSL